MDKEHKIISALCKGLLDIKCYRHEITNYSGDFMRWNKLEWYTFDCCLILKDIYKNGYIYPKLIFEKLTINASETYLHVDLAS